VSNPYLEKYQHLIQNGKAYSAEPQPNNDPYGNNDPLGGDYDPEGNWDNWDAAGSNDPLFNEGEFPTQDDFYGDGELNDAFGPEEVPDGDWSVEGLDNMDLEGGAPEVELTDRQKHLLERTQERRSKVEEEFHAAQQDFQALEEGRPNLKQKDMRLDNIQDTLDDLIKDLSKIDKSREKLSNMGLDVDALLDGGSAPLSAEEQDLLGPDLPMMGDEIKSDIEEFKQEVDKSEAEVINLIKAEGIKEKIDLLNVEDEKQLDDVKYGFLHAKEYITGGNGTQYGTAKVLGKKHIRRYHEGPSDAAEAIFQSMADAVGSGDWSGVISQVESIKATEVDNALGLVFVVLEKHHPELMGEIPSNVLEKFHKNIMERGNNPSGSSIVRVKSDDEGMDAGKVAHVIFSGGWSAFDIRDKSGNKVWKLKDNRRRSSLKKIGTSYDEAASAFLAQARTNKIKEESKGIELEGLQNELNTLTADTDWGYDEGYDNYGDEGNALPPEEHFDDPEAAA